MRKFNLNLIPDMLQKNEVTRKEALNLLCEFILSDKPVFGNTPVATPILIKLWKPISAATPPQIIWPARLCALVPIIIHCRIINNSKKIILNTFNYKI